MRRTRCRHRYATRKAFPRPGSDASTPGRRSGRPAAGRLSPDSVGNTEDSMMKRREFLNAAAFTAGGTVIMGRAHALLEAQGGAAGKPLAGAQAPIPPTPKHTYKTRPGKVE